MASLKTIVHTNTDTNIPNTGKLANKHNYSTRNKPNNDIFMIYHQNIRGISKKAHELLISLSYNRPQIICLTEHHLKLEEIHNINLDYYKLGAFFCRKKYSCGEACIFVSKLLKFSIINLEKYH